MNYANPKNYIDLKCYPILEFDTKKRDSLIADCKSQLATMGFCELPGFINQQNIDIFSNEINELTYKSYSRPGSFYSVYHTKNCSLPDEHICRKQFPSNLSVLAYDQIPNYAKVRQLYEWDILTEFISSVLDKKLYRFADPFQALNITIMGDGEQIGWHYDLSDFIITLLLQKPKEGGEFEFAPMIRTPKNENYHAIEKVFCGEYQNMQLISQEPGTLVLFQGVNSIHRVRTVYGSTQRLSAILSYDTKPNFTSTKEMNIYLYGSRAKKYYEVSS